ncbi:hypothetical protein SFK315_1489 [Shigella flexneri K-315]|uniref:Uncharacterized protein n=1 Tax=Shigella flexneri K-315 TaxID=766150 RepID=I6CXU6_SHIFL|nr:hypothetical protein SB521682_2116 [Shigella boydii 5216-82]EIQ24338.1 hypothetical protein SFK315_1489 [Shigella flexneri K-315]
MQTSNAAMADNRSILNAHSIEAIFTKNFTQFFDFHLQNPSR